MTREVFVDFRASDGLLSAWLIGCGASDAPPDHRQMDAAIVAGVSGQLTTPPPSAAGTAGGLQGGVPASFSKYGKIITKM